MLNKFNAETNELTASKGEYYYGIIGFLFHQRDKEDRKDKDEEDKKAEMKKL